MIRLGLTGSIGMGKSTTAQMFREAGIRVHDADATVHALYECEAVGPVGKAFPGVVSDGRIDRAKLGAAVLGKLDQLKKLESIVHPLVHRPSRHFSIRHGKTGKNWLSSTFRCFLRQEPKAA